MTLEGLLREEICRLYEEIHRLRLLLMETRCVLQRKQEINVMHDRCIKQLTSFIARVSFQVVPGISHVPRAIRDLVMKNMTNQCDTLD